MQYGIGEPPLPIGYLLDRQFAPRLLIILNVPVGVRHARRVSLQYPLPPDPFPVRTTLPLSLIAFHLKVRGLNTKVFLATTMKGLAVCVVLPSTNFILEVELDKADDTQGTVIKARLNPNAAKVWRVLI